MICELRKVNLPDPVFFLFFNTILSVSAKSNQPITTPCKTRDSALLLSRYMPQEPHIFPQTKIKLRHEQSFARNYPPPELKTCKTSKTKFYTSQYCTSTSVSLVRAAPTCALEFLDTYTQYVWNPIVIHVLLFSTNVQVSGALDSEIHDSTKGVFTWSSRSEIRVILAFKLSYGAHQRKKHSKIQRPLHHNLVWAQVVWAILHHILQNSNLTIRIPKITTL